MPQLTLHLHVQYILGVRGTRLAEVSRALLGRPRTTGRGAVFPAWREVRSGPAGLLSPPHLPPRRAERPASRPPAVSHRNRHGRHGAPAAVTGAAAAARRGGHAGPRGGGGGSDCRLLAGWGPSPCGVCSAGGPLLSFFPHTSPLYFHRPLAAPSTPAVAAPPNEGRWPPLLYGATARAAARRGCAPLRPSHAPPSSSPPRPPLWPPGQCVPRRHSP